MTWMADRLQRLVRVRRSRADAEATDKLIDEAERTRRELVSITERLARHVAQLRDFAESVGTEGGLRSG